MEEREGGGEGRGRGAVGGAGGEGAAAAGGMSKEEAAAETAAAAATRRDELKQEEEEEEEAGPEAATEQGDDEPEEEREELELCVLSDAEDTVTGRVSGAERSSVDLLPPAVTAAPSPEPFSWRGVQFSALCGDAVQVVARRRSRRRSPLEMAADEAGGASVDMREASLDFYVALRRVVSMSKPVAAGALAVFAYAALIVSRYDSEDLLFRRVMYYDPAPGETFWQRLAGHLTNGAIIVGCMVVITLQYVLIYYYEWKTALVHVTRGSLVLFLAGPYAYFLAQASQLYGLRVDWLTFVVLVANFTAAGVYATVWLPLRGLESRLERPYLILLTLGMAWPLVEVAEGTLWATLVLLVLYDLVAVLHPWGPLRYIMERQGWVHPAELPGLMYRAEFFLLGTGDLVFYFVLLGRAALRSGATALVCLVAVLAGLAGTIILTARSSAAALPALPLSISLGLFFYFLADSLMEPFARSMAVLEQ